MNVLLIYLSLTRIRVMFIIILFCSTCWAITSKWLTLRLTAHTLCSHWTIFLWLVSSSRGRSTCITGISSIWVLCSIIPIFHCLQSSIHSQVLIQAVVNHFFSEEERELSVPSVSTEASSLAGINSTLSVLQATMLSLKKNSVAVCFDVMNSFINSLNLPLSYLGMS